MQWNQHARKLRPEEIKAVFVDVDGTLVSLNTHRPVPEAMAALARIQASGRKVCLATGRSYQVLGDLKKRPFDAFVCSSGQYSILGDGSVVREQYLANADIQALCDFLEHKQRMGDESYDMAFIGLEQTYFNHVSPLTAALSEELNFGLHPLADFETIRNGSWLQLMYFGGVEGQAEILQRMPASQATRWHSGFIDIMPLSGGKGDGVRAICEIFAIDPAHALCIGDGENDIAMFREAGLAVAMGNGTQAAKEAADLVTDPVDENGLVAALAELGLINS